MYSPIRAVVTFNSQAFNTSEQKSYFINAGCFGDDLAKWLIQELGKRGIKTDDEPGQEDFGWYLNFEIDGTASIFLVGYRPGDKNNAGMWIGWLERNRGFISSLVRTSRNRHRSGSSRDLTQNPDERPGDSRCALALEAGL
jgi:hypothetical protein